MVEAAQLRKCEELLGKLSEKQGPADRLAGNPVFTFLRGLEGFDSERASECLVKLLNKHYDTIEVLKLASKQDLVEDAGILPGDALRIVAAAKGYVAVRVPNPGATSRCDHTSKPVQGAEHRQDAYRPPALRETAVICTPPGASQSSSHALSLPVMQQQQKVVSKGSASQQEAVKEAVVVNPVVPKQDAVKGSKATLNPSLPSQRAFVDGRTGYAPADARFVAADPTLPHPWRALVDGKTGFVYYWNPVMNLTQYDKPLPPGPSFPSGPPPPGPPPSSLVSAPKLAIPQIVPAPISYPHICRLCNATCISEEHVRSHYNGQRHNAAFKEAHKPAQTAKAVNPAVKETKPAEPQIVWTLKLPSQTEQATGSMQPSQSVPVAESSQSVPVAESMHACGVCHIRCGSEIVLRSHFSGKKHVKSMKLATDTNDNRPTPYLYCSICDVTSMSKKNLVMHFNGKRHAKNMKEDSDSGNSSYYSDSENED